MLKHSDDKTLSTKRKKSTERTRKQKKGSKMQFSLLLLENYNIPTFFTVPSIGALALLLRSSCLQKAIQHTTGSDKKEQKGQKL